ncbi:MAG TPA: hypothetical protein VFE77_11700 [Rhodanobacter sp.]|nr:hypothetical protein [Rhodanobacter sp.]
MKAYKLIAGAAAVLLTFASLRAVLYNVDAWQPGSGSLSTPAAHVTNLKAVVVHPSAAEKRAAAMINESTSPDLMTLSADSANNAEASIQPIGLLGSPLVMPYYSFGKKFGRITKE